MKEDPKSEIFDLGDFGWLHPGPYDRIAVGFVLRFQYRTPQPQPSSGHTVNLFAENVKCLRKIESFGRSEFRLTKIETPRNVFSAFRRFSCHDRYAVGFVTQYQYRTPRPRVASGHPVKFSGETVKKSWPTGHCGLPRLTMKNVFVLQEVVHLPAKLNATF